LSINRWHGDVVTGVYYDEVEGLGLGRAISAFSESRLVNIFSLSGIAVYVTFKVAQSGDFYVPPQTPTGGADSAPQTPKLSSQVTSSFISGRAMPIASLKLKMLI